MKKTKIESDEPKLEDIIEASKSIIYKNFSQEEVQVLVKEIKRLRKLLNKAIIEKTFYAYLNEKLPKK